MVPRLAPGRNPRYHPRVKALPLVVRPGLRFTCHRCGVCCRTSTVGLDPGERERIEGHDWTREGERFRAGFAVPGTDPWGRARDDLRHGPDGACIFLDRDGLCLVEKRLGREAKPRICRKFPFVFVAAPGGERLAVSVECASRWRSLRDGEPVGAQWGDVVFARERSEPHHVKWRVQAAPNGRLLAPEEYAALERRLRADVEVERPILETIRALAAAPPAAFEAALERTLRALVETAGRDTEEGEHLRAVAEEMLAAGPTAWVDVLAAADAARDGAWFLREMLASGLDEALPGRDPTAADGVGHMIAGVVLAAALGRRYARLGSGPGLPAAGPAAAAASAALPPVGWLNLGARTASMFLRGPGGKRLRERAGGLAALARAPT